MATETRTSGNAIGIDLGGTNIKGVLIDTATGEILASDSLATNADQHEDWKNRVRTIEKNLRAHSAIPIVGTGIAAPGLASADGRSIASMPGRMSELEGFDWSSYLNTTVTVLNDAHAALVAEVRYGAAAGLSQVVMLTLGTGVGGALWLNGDLVTGRHGRAGHLGHITLQPDSLDLDITGTPGSLEDAIGNLSVARRTYARYQDTAALVEGYRKGEPIATLSWLGSVRSLAASVASLINTFSPEAVVIGGGIAQAGEALFIPLQRFLELFEWRPDGTPTPIKKALFDQWSGAVGAAARSVFNR